MPWLTGWTSPRRAALAQLADYRRDILAAIPAEAEQAAAPQPLASKTVVLTGTPHLVARRGQARWRPLAAKVSGSVSKNRFCGGGRSRRQQAGQGAGAGRAGAGRSRAAGLAGYP